MSRLRALGAAKRRPWARVVLTLLCWVAAVPAKSAPPGDLHVVIIGGIGGEARYTREIRASVDRLLDAWSASVEKPERILGLVGDEATAEAVEQGLAALRTRVRSDDRVVVVLLGHGSSDAGVYKHNLRGPDVTAPMLASWLDALPARRQLIVNATSASGAMLAALERPERIVITATRSGTERNATVFGVHWADALSAREADLDRNGWITAAEAFAWTRDAVDAYYTRERRLVTEHAQLVGASAVDFPIVDLSGARAREAGVDRPASDRRAALLGAIEALRARKSELPEATYYKELETLLIPLAELTLAPSSLPTEQGSRASGAGAEVAP